ISTTDCVVSICGRSMAAMGPVRLIRLFGSWPVVPVVDNPVDRDSVYDTSVAQCADIRLLTVSNSPWYLLKYPGPLARRNLRALVAFSSGNTVSVWPLASVTFC